MSDHYRFLTSDGEIEADALYDAAVRRHQSAHFDAVAAGGCCQSIYWHFERLWEIARDERERFIRDHKEPTPRAHRKPEKLPPLTPEQIERHHYECRPWGAQSLINGWA
jgi:hypothetical protein